MTLEFAEKWRMASLSSEKVMEAEDEKLLVTLIVESCNCNLLKEYLRSPKAQVYVKTGLHVSRADHGLHIMLQLGLPDHPYSSNDWPAWTAHIRLNSQFLQHGDPRNMPVVLFKGGKGLEAVEDDPNHDRLCTGGCRVTPPVLRMLKEGSYKQASDMNTNAFFRHERS